MMTATPTSGQPEPARKTIDIDQARAVHYPEIVLGRLRCLYCDESMSSPDEMLDHLPRCRVRKAALEAEAALNRILTDEEIADIRQRF